MSATWLIEQGVYGDEAISLLREIRRQGKSGEIIPHSMLKKGSTPIVEGKSVSSDACVIGYGTFPFAQQILIHHPWKPGAWCSALNLDCGAYYAHFGRFLLNQHYVIMPGVEAIRQRDWLFSILGENDTVFARPTGCHKVFTGRCMSRDAFAHGLAPARYDVTTLVVIAAPRPIDREWRVIVTADRVLTGSQYSVNGIKEITPDFPEEIRSYAETLLKEVRWRPDPIFVMDIGESQGQLWLIELNSFSGAGWYASDRSIIVAEASALAEGLR